MKRFLLAILLVCLGTAGFASVRVLQTSPNEIIIEYVLDDYRLERDGDYTHIKAASLNYPSQTGAPLLPYEEIKIAVPPEGGIDYSVLSIQSKKVRLDYDILPAPQVLSTNTGSELLYSMDRALYASKSPEFIEPLLLSSFRDYSYVPIRINSFSLQGDRELQVVEQAVIRIGIKGDVSHKSNRALDSLRDVLLNQVVNPEQAHNWRSFKRTHVNHAEFSRSDWWIRIETDKEGFYKIGPSQLSTLQVSDIDPRTFRLFSTGGAVMKNTIVDPGLEFMELPIIVTGESDGSFDASDYIMFYGSSRDGLDKNENIKTRHFVNPYSANTVYWLTFGGDFDTPPQRIETLPEQTTWNTQRSSQPFTLRVEEEVHRRETEGFDWYMTKFFGQTTADYQLQFTLQDVDPSGEQRLQFSMIQDPVGPTATSSISVYINDMLVYNTGAADSTIFTWSGTGEYMFNKAHSHYRNGTNTIRFRVHRTRTNNLYLNYYIATHYQTATKRSGQYLSSIAPSDYFQNIRYNFTGSVDASTKVYRVKGWSEISEINPQISATGLSFVGSGIADTKFWLLNPNELLSPVLVERSYPNDLVSTPNQIDNVIVSPLDFYEQALDLAEFYWQEYQVRSLVVKQTDIFNQFNGGHPDPAAIKQFVRYLYYNYPAPALTSMTLLGLGSIDWRNFSRQAADKNKIMVYQKGKDVSDDYLGMINTPNYPEIAIGRYPVKNLNELNLMLSNMRSYVQNPTPGWWRNSALIVADDLTNGNTTGEYIHTQQAQNAGESLSKAVIVDKIMGMDYDYDEFQNKPKARDDMFEKINDGTLVWYYIGHGSYDKLGAEDYLNGATDMNRFNNPGKLSFFIAASCKVGHFDYWGFESLAQKVVLLNNLGSIGSYAGTRETYPYQNAPLMIGTLDHMINRRNPVGYSILHGKISYTQSNSNDEKYALLGDPLLRINPPERDTTLSVFVDGQTTSQIFSRQKVDMSGQFAQNGLNGVTEVAVFGSDEVYGSALNTPITRRGANLFRGSSTVSNSSYSASFIVPDDVIPGNTGSVINYFWDSGSKKDFINYKYPLNVSDHAVIVENNDVPQIDIYLGSLDYRQGDTVGTNTTLIAKISDENGINVTGSAGHNILLILDGANQPIAVTEYFEYDQDSHTHGTLKYPLSGLSEGFHTLQLIAFDNFNRPSVANTDFIVKKSGELSIERLLTYPNPMKTDTQITFILSQAADISINIYTMSGRRIRTIKATGKHGFNQIFWDGRDADGDRIANNTYFIKVKASTPDNKSVEKTERIVVYR